MLSIFFIPFLSLSSFDNEFEEWVDVKLLRVGNVSIFPDFEQSEGTVKTWFEELRDGKIKPLDLIQESPIYVTEVDGLYWASAGNGRVWALRAYWFHKRQSFKVRVFVQGLEMLSREFMLNTFNGQEVLLNTHLPPGMDENTYEEFQLSIFKKPLNQHIQDILKESIASKIFHDRKALGEHTKYTNIEAFTFPDEFSISYNGRLIQEYILTCKCVFLCEERGIGRLHQYATRRGMDRKTFLKHFGELHDMNKRVRINYAFPEGIPTGLDGLQEALRQSKCSTVHNFYISLLKDSNFDKEQTIQFRDSHGFLHIGNVADYLMNFETEYNRMTKKNMKICEEMYKVRQKMVNKIGLDPPKFERQDFQHEGKRILKIMKEYRFWNLYRFGSMKGNDSI